MRPLFKKHHDKDIDNYRHIILILELVNFFEKACYSRLNYYLSKCKFICDFEISMKLSSTSLCMSTIAYRMVVKCVVHSLILLDFMQIMSYN